MDNEGYLYHLIYESMEEQEQSRDSLHGLSPDSQYSSEDSLDQKKKSLQKTV